MRDELTRYMQELDRRQLYDALFRDPLTGLLNRRAFELTGSAYVAIVDVDSLKWVNDNRGYREGDALIKLVADRLADVFGDSAFRISGDEFAVRVGERVGLARTALAHVRSFVNNFSFGIGRDLVEADASLKLDKQARLQTGQRAARGERPAWL